MIRNGHVIFLCALALLTIGVVMVQSAGMSVAPIDPAAAGEPQQGITVESLLSSSTARHLVIAIGAMALFALLPIRRFAGAIERRAWLPPGGDLGALVLGSVVLIGVLVTVYVPGIARPRYGAHRWVDLRVPGFESTQPSEFVKWGLVVLVALYAARLAARSGKGLEQFWKGFLPAIVCVGLVTLVIVVEDLGTGVLIVGACSVVLIAAGARLAHFALFVPPAAALVYAAIVTSPYRVARITAFLRPYEDPEGIGYQMIQSLSTISGGGLTGRGLGNGLQKFGYLPEDTTDFLFAVVCEELGIVGALIVVLLYVTITWVGTQIAREETSTLLRLIVIGVVSTFAIQALMNLMVVTGLGPTKGIALPLMSSGGTGWLVTSACLGAVISIDRSRTALTIESEDAEEETAAPTIVVRARSRTSAARDLTTSGV